MSREEAPRYVGGQAVIEGVMMRGATTWAVSVRSPEGAIVTEIHDAPAWAQRWSRWPLVRGIATLGESLQLGLKALTWSAEQSLPEEERQPTGAATKGTMAVALLLFAGIFIVSPGVVAHLLADRVDALDGPVAFNVVEAVIRLTLFLGYLWGIGRIPDIRRVFQYHGAEHKAIAAYERGAPLTAASAQRYTTEHVRCGTNFLLTVMVVTILSHIAFGRPEFLVLLASRILLIPVVAAVSYEIIRAAAAHVERRWVRALMLPGLSLQRLTTREPDDDQVEVAIASLKAVLDGEQLAEVEARQAA
jgi:uncharacterized protein YqhQ